MRPSTRSTYEDTGKQKRAESHGGSHNFESLSWRHFSFSSQIPSVKVGELAKGSRTVWRECWRVFCAVSLAASTQRYGYFVKGSDRASAPQTHRTFRTKDSDNGVQCNFRTRSLAGYMLY